MKKVISWLTALSLVVSSGAFPVFAADDTDTEEGTDASLEERVAEGLANYERGFEILEKSKDVSLEDTLKRWDDYLSGYDDLMASLTEIDKLQDQLNSAEDGSSGSSSDESGDDGTDIAEDNSDYEGLGTGQIPKKHVSKIMYDAVKAVMPEKYWNQMDIEGEEKYHLYFIDGNIIVMTEFVIEICEGKQKTIRDIAILKDESQKEIYEAIDKTDKLLKALDDLLGLSEADDKKEYIQDSVTGTIKDKISEKITEYSMAAVLYAAKKATEKLYNVFFAINERNRELAEIDAEMEKLGLWNVYNEDTDIPGGVSPSGNTGNAEGEISDETPDTPKLPKLVYNLGSGDDTYHIYDTDEPVYAIIAETGAGQSGNDTISFEYDLSPDDVQFVRNDGDLYINDLKNEVYILIPEYFDNEGKRIENIRFTDGTVLGYDDVCSIADVHIGTDEDDTITGFVQVNHIFGLEGNDTLSGNTGNDDLFGFGGDDIITVVPGCNGLFGTGGNDFIYGMDGNDKITAGNGDDFIWGGKGDDYINSGSGNDIIYYELGDGNDIVDDTTGRFTFPNSGYDVIWLGEGILPEEVRVSISEDQYEFVLHIMKTGETITIPGNTYSGLSPVFPVEEIRFADGTSWNREKLLELVRTVYGTDGDDELYARVGTGVTLYGLDGNDRMFGSDGNDLFYGNKGDDYIRGGGGDDTFFYEPGDGNDIIDMGNGKYSYPQGGYNVLSFGDGILPDEVTVERSLDDYTYTLWINKTGESVTMTGNVVSGVSNMFPVKEIRFSDGTSWDVKYLESHSIKRVIGTDGNDSLNDSNDDDIIYCGRGNDYIRGKSGDDLYIYEPGDGRDTIMDYSIWGSGYNTVRFEDGISIEDLYQEKVVYKGNTYTRLYIKDRSSFLQISGIQEIRFADGEPLELRDVLDQIPSADELRSGVQGDLSCDGIVSAADISLMLEYMSDSMPVSYLETADINGDGTVNIADLSLLKELCLKD